MYLRDMDKLPQDVSFLVGNRTKTRYLSLNLHYKDAFSVPDNSGMKFGYTLEPTKYQAGIIAALNYGMQLKAKLPDQRVAWQCQLSENVSITVFATHVHSHSYCKNVPTFTLLKMLYFQLEPMASFTEQKVVPIIGKRCLKRALNGLIHSSSCENQSN